MVVNFVEGLLLRKEGGDEKYPRVTKLLEELKETKEKLAIKEKKTRKEGNRGKKKEVCPHPPGS